MNEPTNATPTVSKWIRQSTIRCVVHTRDSVGLVAIQFDWSQKRAAAKRFTIDIHRGQFSLQLFI